MDGSVESLRLREWSSGDEDVLTHLANDRGIWRNLTNRFPHPYERDDATLWIRTANRRPEQARHFAIVVEDAVVGGVGFERLTDLSTLTAEIGYWIGAPYRRKGYATTALLRATEIAYRHFDFVRLQAGVLGWNEASCRVLERAGYTLEARHRHQGYKDGAVCDIVLYAMLREEWPNA